MTSDALSKIHSECFPAHATWDSATFQNYLNDPTIRLFSTETGFLLVRECAPEAEILTLAVRPLGRRCGVASGLIDQLIKKSAENQFESIFLEVSTENAAAIALYQKFGFKQVGRRKDYYASPHGKRVDALVMSRAIDLPTTKKHP